MEIYFPDAERRQLFSIGSELRARFGDELADVICCRLQLLKKARTLALVPNDSPINRRHDAKRSGVFSVSLGEFHRLLFEAVDAELATTGCTDPEEIQFVRVLAVDDSSPDKGSPK